MDYGRPINPFPSQRKPDFHKARARFRRTHRKKAELKLEDLKVAFARGSKPPDCSYVNDLVHDDLVNTMRLIRKGRYKPGLTRTCRIPKASGGYRTLEIPLDIDKAVSRACLNSISPQIEKQFDSRSHGGRKRLGVQTAMANACKGIVSGLRYALSADIKEAFNNVPTEQALDCLASFIPGHYNLELINTCVRGHFGAAKKKGIRQGDPLSPAVFNAAMHYWIDQWIDINKDFLFIRYLDNLYLFSRKPELGKKVLEYVRQRLDLLGLTLLIDKEVDLNNSQQIDILGFQVGVTDAKINIAGTQKSWDRLKANLAKAFDEPNPQLNGGQIVRGWLESQAIRDMWSPNDTDRLNELIKQQGLDLRVKHAEVIEMRHPLQKKWELLLKWTDLKVSGDTDRGTETGPTRRIG